MAKPKHGRCGNNNIHTPSPTILALLALIAPTTQVVAGGPLPLPTSPPSFLCPFIDRGSVDTADPPTPSCSTSSPAPTPTSRHPRGEVIADRYVQGSDSSWRKTDAWTLYGSTCCTTSTTTHSHSSQTPMPTSEIDISILPAGWETATSASTSRDSNTTLALASILAGSICMFMLGCVLWRRRKKKTRDIERKLGHKLSSDDDLQGNAREKDSRGKMRAWVKASARWRSNVRQSARRRRKRQVPAIPLPPSRRGSFVSDKLDLSASQANLSLSNSVSDSVPVLPDLPRPPSPPTYGASFVTGFSCPPSPAIPHSISALSLDNPCMAQCSSAHPAFVEEEPLPYTPPPDGHVATDDKAQLAHLRDLANSPPTILDVASGSTLQPVSAPQWHEVEDDLEDVDLSQVPMSFHDLPPSFLPLPDVPSGPPPGVSPSAPPVDDLGLEPSAPSLDDEDELFRDWDGASSYALETPFLVDPNSTPTCATELSICQTVSSRLPSVRESATKDSILPRYHP